MASGHWLFPRQKSQLFRSIRAWHMRRSTSWGLHRACSGFPAAQHCCSIGWSLDLNSTDRTTQNISQCLLSIGFVWTPGMRLLMASSTELVRCSGLRLGSMRGSERLRVALNHACCFRAQPRVQSCALTIGRARWSQSGSFQALLQLTASFEKSLRWPSASFGFRRESLVSRRLYRVGLAWLARSGYFRAARRSLVGRLTLGHHTQIPTSLNLSRRGIGDPCCLHVPLRSQIYFRKVSFGSTSFLE